MISNYVKHCSHCLLLLGLILVFELSANSARNANPDINPWVTYGITWTIILYFFKAILFVPVPQAICNFAGLVFYNAFPKKVSFKGSKTIAPFICFRVVTRGDYPELVHLNVKRNMKTCLDTGLENFCIEVVSDKAIGLQKQLKLREVVVPNSYRTKSGAMYKARALQYCLEDDVSVLSDDDWVVHLDEETLLTNDCIQGILNFVSDGKHYFGQGLVTYANEPVVNWVTTLADSARVADDLGKLRLTLKMFHKPLFSWKGSFVVAKFAAEKRVSYDNGVNGSIAEDCYFALKAFNEGYTFNFIEGEMCEKSPFSIWDFLRQRKRWYQGIYLVVHSDKLPWSKKFFVAVLLYNFFFTPLYTCNMILSSFYPIPYPPIIDFVSALTAAVNIYMFIFGAVKSLTLSKVSMLQLLLCVFGLAIVIPVNMFIENIAAVWSVVGKKHQFEIVDKKIQSVAGESNKENNRFSLATKNFVSVVLQGVKSVFKKNLD
ncbi:beta-1,4-mannosyltransferase egh-like [Agrilus planipennis]|uniref:Beta-1,4-mannosyltransferase egh-like n=1 Tax=Agrilus planipennis TaxID=224129 RepID=A0A1W4XKS6_AGRPL|nr:beta-1,4-mannosyltransferase egh-like [Agrilus planipennis]